MVPLDKYSFWIHHKAKYCSGFALHNTCTFVQGNLTYTTKLSWKFVFLFSWLSSPKTTCRSSTNAKVEVQFWTPFHTINDKWRLYIIVENKIIAKLGNLNKFLTLRKIKDPFDRFTFPSWDSPYIFKDDVEEWSHLNRGRWVSWVWWDRKVWFPELYRTKYLFVNDIVADHPLQGLLPDVRCDDGLLFTAVEASAAKDLLNGGVGDFAGGNNFLIFFILHFVNLFIWFVVMIDNIILDNFLQG